MNMDGRKGKSSQVLLPRYTLGRTLGVGASSTVKIAHHMLSGREVAVKIVDLKNLSEEEENRVRREATIMKKISHPNVIRLYDTLESKSKMYLVMEYMDCGELYYYIAERGRLQEDNARHIFQQIICGVEFCHLNLVVHRDLKPENLLIDSKCNVKITDFGLSNVMRDGYFLKTRCGSLNYAAPELISGNLYAGPEIDVWSCGVILYTLVCGRLPFDNEDTIVLCRQIQNGQYVLPQHLSHEARDLICRILVTDPIRRYSIPEIRKHPWFRVNIPLHVSMPVRDFMERSKEINEDILQDMSRIGFHRDYVIYCLQDKMHNEATVTHNLLSDHHFRISSTNHHGIHADVEWTSLVHMNRSNSELGLYNGRTSPGISSPDKMDWAIGLQSSAQPRQIMDDVLTTFQRLKICWKNIGSYNMRCRWLPDVGVRSEALPSPSMNSLPDEEPSSSYKNCSTLASPNVVRFEIQLYKTCEGKYLLDLQLVSGQPILFLDVCYAFISELQYCGTSSVFVGAAAEG